MRKCQSFLMRKWRATAAASTASLLLGMSPRCVPVSAYAPARLNASTGCSMAVQTSTFSGSALSQPRCCYGGFMHAGFNGGLDEMCLVDARTMCVGICASRALAPCISRTSPLLLIILGRQISLGRNRFGALNAAAAAGGPPPRALSPQAREAARRVYSAGIILELVKLLQVSFAMHALPWSDGAAGCMLLSAVEGVP